MLSLEKFRPFKMSHVNFFFPLQEKEGVFSDAHYRGGVNFGTLNTVLHSHFDARGIVVFVWVIL
jgi:hypothetical protein